MILELDVFCLILFCHRLFSVQWLWWCRTTVSLEKSHYTPWDLLNLAGTLDKILVLSTFFCHLICSPILTLSPLFYWQSGPENRRHLPFVLGAAVFPAPLWLRYASCEVCTHCSRESEAEVPWREWECPVAQGINGCEPGQVSCPGCATLSGDTLCRNSVVNSDYVFLSVHVGLLTFIINWILTGYYLRFISWSGPSKARLWSPL